MLSDILKLNGITEVNKKQLKSIKGGLSWRVDCRCEDGSMWTVGTTNSYLESQHYRNLCINDGGHPHVMKRLDPPIPPPGN